METRAKLLDVVPRTMLNNLSPPTGTSYFSHSLYTFFSEDVTDFNTGTVQWKADVYIYTTGAHPNDPDFAQKGLIKIIFVHTGFIRLNSPDILKSFVFTISPLSSGLLPVMQLPRTGSGTEGPKDDYTYEIDFAEKMPMFTNNGNQPFTFDAAYKETFTCLKAKQTGSRSNDIKFEFVSLGSSSNHSLTEICGFSMFSHDNPAEFPITIRVLLQIMVRGVSHIPLLKEVQINLGFSTERRRRMLGPVVRPYDVKQERISQ